MLAVPHGDQPSLEPAMNSPTTTERLPDPASQAGDAAHERRLARIRRHARTVSGLWNLGEADPPEAERDRAERDVRDLYDMIRENRPVGWLLTSIAKLDDDALAAMTTQARIWLQHERASRATQLYLVIVQEWTLNSYEGRCHRAARKLVRMLTREAETRIAKYQNGIRALKKAIR